MLNDPKQLTFDPANVLVYSESDFKSMYDHFHKIGGFSIKFRFVISGNPANQGGRLYDALCEEPEIAEKLNRPKAPKG